MVVLSSQEKRVLKKGFLQDVNILLLRSRPRTEDRGGYKPRPVGVGLNCQGEPLARPLLIKIVVCFKGFFPGCLSYLFCCHLEVSVI